MEKQLIRIATISLYIFELMLSFFIMNSHNDPINLAVSFIEETITDEVTEC